LPAAADLPLDIRLLDYRDLTHPQAGGAERYLHEVFRRIAARGHRVGLLAARYAGAEPLGLADGIAVERRGTAATFNWVALAACRRWAREGRVDVVVENLCKIPFFTPALGGGIPAVVLVHHLFGGTVFQEVNPLAGAYVWLHERFVPAAYRRAELVAVSATTREDLEARGLRGVPIEVIPNGVDTSFYRPAPGTHDGTPPRLAYVGRVKRYKRIDLLLRAAARLRTVWPGLEVEIVGRGDHRAALERLAGRLGIASAVRFTGYVSEEEKRERLRRADVLVYPSPKEGWGIAAMEAAACGVPVVASDSPGLRDAVRHEETGLLVPHGDLEALTAALSRLLADAPLRRRLGEAGVPWARQFSWDHAADRIETRLRAAAARGRAR
jgi:glycosyltransferase involved in cell wall biosynthesis